MNNVGYTLAVEKLLGIQDPPRSQVIRVLISELARIARPHRLRGRQRRGHRRLHGLPLPLPGAGDHLRPASRWPRASACTPASPASAGSCGTSHQSSCPCAKPSWRAWRAGSTRWKRLLTRNPIWADRTKGVGAISPEDAINWGYTGPCLRAAGVAQDLRKAQPYLGYDTYDFDIPIGTTGDVYDRYLVRTEEMRQSLRIVQQALAKLREIGPGPIIVDDYKIALPPKEKVYTRMESLIHHFKLVMHGIEMPVGEVYSATEAANGELGFYIVSDGGKSPYRIHVRPPCYPIFSSFDEQVKGRLIADAVAILGAINVVAGETGPLGCVFKIPRAAAAPTGMHGKEADAA